MSGSCDIEDVDLLLALKRVRDDSAFLQNIIGGILVLVGVVVIDDGVRSHAWLY